MWPFSRKSEARSLENPSVSLSDPRALQLFGVTPSSAGVTVTPDNALGVTAFWAAVNFLAQTIGALPLHVMRKTATAPSGPRTIRFIAILGEVVNEDGLTSLAWREWLMTSTLLTGRAVTYIGKSKANKVSGLYPLETSKLTVERVGGRRRYVFKDGSTTRTYEPSEVIDVAWRIMPDGFTAVNPIARLKGAFGLAIALEEYAAKFFQNGGVPPLALQGPIATAAGAKRASLDVQAALQAAKEDGRNVLVLPAGHELKAVGVDPTQSQMEAARRFQVEEIARIVGLPPMFIQDLSRANFANSEQQDLHLVKHTIVQWCEKIEAELNAKCFGARNRTSYAELYTDGLLRGDFKTRMDGLSKGVQNALFKPNEGRALLGLPADPKGGDLLIQGATVPVGSQPVLAAPPAQPEGGAQ
jgi:HK97 family phage portal protein